MPDLNFEILGVEPERYAVAPTLLFKLQVTNRVPREEVFAAALKGQFMIEAVPRRYGAPTQERLLEVFGEPSRWDETLNSLLWTHVSVPLPRFTGSTLIQVPVACGQDFELASNKYFHALREGVVPIALLLSGTIFYSDPEGMVLVTQLPWEKEASFQMPARLWRDLMQSYYPDTRWLRVGGETFDKLQRFKALSALPTFDLCLEALLGRVAEGPPLPEEATCH
jgi:hypothetical protein